jgi:hypothetical protein
MAKRIGQTVNELGAKLNSDESEVASIIYDYLETLPPDFFKQSVDALNEHFGGHDNMMVTENVRQYLDACRQELEEIDGNADADQDADEDDIDGEDFDEDDIGIKLLTPSASIDVNKILSVQMKEWYGEYEEEDWSLIAYPVLAGGKVALLFELPIYEDTADEDTDEDEQYPSANRYRVLVFDARTGEQVDKNEFRINNGYATTVFYRDGILYAPISQEGACSYTLLKIAEDHDDEDELYIGDNINCLAAAENGDIIVSYNFTGEDMDEVEEDVPMFSNYHLDGTFDDFGTFYNKETGETADEYIEDVTLDAQDRVWAVMDNGTTLVMHEKDGSTKTYDLLVGYVDTVAMPDDLSLLYSSTIGDEDDKYMIFCYRMEAGELVDEDPSLCVIQTPDGDTGFSSGTTTMKNIMATLIDGVIYTVDLNKQ